METTIIHGNQNTTKLINQLKASAKQYPLLDKAAEKAMIRKYKKDRDELNRMLFMHNIRTVFSMAKTYMSKTRDFDSLVQNGMLGLMEAAKRFDIRKDVKFCTYATIWVKKYMTMDYYTSQYKVDASTVSINSPTFQDIQQEQGISGDESFENVLTKYMDASYSPVQKTIESEITDLEQAELCEKLYHAVNQDTQLTAMDKAVFSDIFKQQEKTRDIAQKYKIDPVKISEIRHRVLDKMRIILKKQYNVRTYSDIG